MNHGPLKIRTFFCPASKHVTRKNTIFIFTVVNTLTSGGYVSCTDLPTKYFCVYKCQKIFYNAWESTEVEVFGTVHNLEL